MRARFTAQPVGYGHPVLLQMYWRPGTSGGSTADATDILARVRAALSGSVLYFSGNCVWTATPEVDALEDSTGALTGAFIGTAPATVTGTATGDNLSAALSTLMKSSTALVVRGRFLKGRSYLAGPTEGTTDSAGRPGNAPGTIQTAWNGMLTGGSTASFPVVWSRPTAPGAANGTSGPILAYTMETRYYGVQRKRRL